MGSVSGTSEVYTAVYKRGNTFLKHFPSPFLLSLMVAQLDARYEYSLGRDPKIIY